MKFSANCDPKTIYIWFQIAQEIDLFSFFDRIKNINRSFNEIQLHAQINSIIMRIFCYNG